MNKTEVVQAVAKRTRIRPDVVDEVLESFLHLVSLSVTLEESVTLRGFGKFATRTRPPANLKHPRTGAPLPTSERKTVVFLPSPNLKERVNGGGPR